MFLALREIRRAPVRFGLLVAAIALLVFLILFQQSLQSGLTTSFSGAVANQSAPVVVFPVDGRRNLQGSVVLPDLEQAVATADGVAATGRIGQRTASVRTASEAVTATVVIGYSDPALGAPDTLRDGRLPEGPGEAVASAADSGDGYALGETVTVLPGGLDVEIVGVADDVNLSASPTLFVDYPTFEEVVSAANPDAGDPLPSAIAAQPADGVTPDELVANINAASDELDALTRDDAAAAAPGVASVTMSFRMIFALFALVVPLVTALFFLIVTVQKAPALTLLRAIGAPARRLVASLLIQVVLLVGAGVLVGTLLYVPVSSLQIGSVQLRFEAGAVVAWGVAILVLGVASSLFAAGRVLRIDPVEATTGGAGR